MFNLNNEELLDPHIPSLLRWLISTCSCAEQQAHHGEAEESADQPLPERAEGSDPGRDEEGRKLQNHDTLHSSDSLSRVGRKAEIVLHTLRKYIIL